MKAGTNNAARGTSGISRSSVRRRGYRNYRSGRQPLNAKIGLWIDHRKAVVVAISDTGEKINQILSNVEKQHGRIGGVRSVTSYESQKVAASDIHQREFTGRLNAFYEKVIASVRSADSILVMGPGEAKGELKKRLLKNSLGGRIAGMVTVDRMTVPQIAAKVRAGFPEIESTDVKIRARKR